MFKEEHTSEYYLKPFVISEIGLLRNKTGRPISVQNSIFGKSEKLEALIFGELKK